MIRSKMEMSCLITSLNELEKLKLLLFDDNQLFLFEHIPKPFLIDPAGQDDDDDEEEEASPAKEGEEGKDKKKKNKKKKKKPKSKNDMLISSNKGFWQKQENSEESFENFNQALDAIKQKGDKMNIIDERLFNALNIPLPNKKEKSPPVNEGQL